MENLGFVGYEDDPCRTEVLSESGACYWLESTETTWQDALITCSSKDGTLAVVDSETIFNFTKPLINQLET